LEGQTNPFVLEKHKAICQFMKKFFFSTISQMNSDLWLTYSYKTINPSGQMELTQLTKKQSAP